MQRHRFVVPAEGVPARDRRGEQGTLAQLPHELRDRDRQRRTVGHHVHEPGVGPKVFEGDGDWGNLGVQRRRDDRHPRDGSDVAELRMSLLGTSHVHLQRRVPELHQVPALFAGPRVPLEVPVHDVPPTGSEPELDRGGVHDDPVPDVDGPDKLREHVGGLVACSEVYGDALQEGTFREK